MTTLSEALTEYVAMRRNLRFVFRLPASLLRTFVAFVDQAGSPFITTELVVRPGIQWCILPPCKVGAQGLDDDGGHVGEVAREGHRLPAAGVMIEAQPVGCVTKRMESSDGFLGVVGVDVKEAALRTDGDMSVVSQGLYRGAALLGRLVVRCGVGATAGAWRHAAMPERNG